MNKLSYALGMVIGENLKSMGVSADALDGADFATAIGTVLAGGKTKMGSADAQRMVAEFLQAREEELSKANREAGERFLAENAKKEGVVVLPSGLQYTVLHEGKGRKPEATDSVKCHYEGKLIDGTVFDSSYRRGEAAIFPLDSVISGWTEGLQLMKEGSVYRFCIPYDLAYGSQGAGQSIPPYAALLFDIELIEVL